MKKLLTFLTNRVLLFAIPFLLQLFLVFVVVFFLEDYILFLQGFMALVGLTASVYIINKNDNPAYKIGWIIVILLVPIFGAFIYLFYGGKKLPKTLERRLEEVGRKTSNLLTQDERIIREIKEDNEMAGGQSQYILKEGYPVYRGTEVTFFPIGEAKYESMLQDLKGARHYIFLQYFIISEGKMWSSILEILREKVEQGLDVRVMFDDFGCLTTLPTRYEKTLKAYGIKCHVGNPLRVYRNFTMVQNNRDHRKILIVDGHTGYTGGINLADEYINEKVRFGHWKDCAVKVKGEATWNLTIEFLKAWMLYDEEKQDFEKYRPDRYLKEKMKSDGYVQPFGDSPLDYNNVGENVYLNIIHNATEELFIATPYLILTNEMLTALTLAASRGVDVRILTPHIPDKKSVFLITQSFYGPLVEAGVRIYEYTAGFVHSKTFIADQKIGVCGTINLDYRSLYLHFEDAVWMYKCEALKDMRMDYLETVEKSKEIRREEINGWSQAKKIRQAVLRMFAPLM